MLDSNVMPKSSHPINSPLIIHCAQEVGRAKHRGRLEWTTSFVMDHCWLFTLWTMTNFCLSFHFLSFFHLFILSFFPSFHHRQLFTIVFMLLLFKGPVVHLYRSCLLTCPSGLTSGINHEHLCNLTWLVYMYVTRPVKRKERRLFLSFPCRMFAVLGPHSPD